MFSFFNQINIYNKLFLEIKLRVIYIIISWIITFIISFLYKEQFIFILGKYLLYNMASHRFIFTELTTILLTYFKLSFFLSILIQVPFILIHFCYFFLASFYYFEWRRWLFINFFSLCFYILSVFLTYFFIFPGFIDIFLVFETKNSILYFPLHFEAKINDFFNLLFLTFLNVCFCFQFPILIYILLFFKIISFNYFIQSRKVFYLLFLIFSAIISPPEIISQLIIFLFFIFFYEIIIFILLFK